MTDTIAGAYITGGIALTVSLVAAGSSLWNNSKTGKNAVQIEEVKARLSHGQVVTSTQWTAEFHSYQAIWKGMVAARTLADKLVTREDEVSKLGFPAEYLADPARIEIAKALLPKFVHAGTELLLAIHENAPFYPANIREAANDTHCSVKQLTDKYLLNFAQLTQGVLLSKDKHFIAETNTILLAIFEGVDLVESLIRDRLAAVTVTDL